MSALEAWIEIELARPCKAGAPLLHQLVDGELSRARERVARAHLRRCEPCRAHLQLLELEEQTIRELAAPSARRFVALWSERLEQKMNEAVAEEARAAPADHSSGNAGSGLTTSSCSNVASPTRKRTV